MRGGRALKNGTHPVGSSLLPSLFLQVFTTQFSGWEIKQARCLSSGGRDELVAFPELSERLPGQRGGLGIRGRKGRYGTVGGGKNQTNQSSFLSSVSGCSSASDLITRKSKDRFSGFHVCFLFFCCEFTLSTEIGGTEPERHVLNLFLSGC